MMGVDERDNGFLVRQPRDLGGVVCPDVSEGHLVAERPVVRLRVGERAHGDGGRGAVAGGGDVDAAEAVVAELHCTTRREAIILSVSEQWSVAWAPPSMD